LREQIERQNHRTLVSWVLDCAPHVPAIFEKKRPREALEAARQWARSSDDSAVRH
jgi:hypothetical protein